MRTNIELEDDLMAEAMKATGAKTKRATVEAALRLVVRLKAQEGIRDLRGKITFWDGYAEELRNGSDEIPEW